MYGVPRTSKLTGPGVDVEERSERATLFRLRFSVLLAHLSLLLLSLGRFPDLHCLNVRSVDARDNIQLFVLPA